MSTKCEPHFLYLTRPHGSAQVIRRRCLGTAAVSEGRRRCRREGRRTAPSWRRSQASSASRQAAMRCRRSAGASAAAVHLRRCHALTQTFPSSAPSGPCFAAALQTHPTPTPPCGQSTQQRHQRPTRTGLAARVVSTCMRGRNHACACTTHTLCGAHLENTSCAECHAHA